MAVDNHQKTAPNELEIVRLRLENYKLHQESFDKTAAFHLASVTSFATAAIRGVFFLNGAAAIAVLAAQDIPPGIRMDIIYNGAWGSIYAVLCAGLSYLSQRVYMAADLHVCAEKWCTAFREPIPKQAWFESVCSGHVLSFAAILFFCASLGKFIQGLAILPPLFPK